MLHTCCTYNTPTLHACCIHKNWLSATRIPYKHMKKCMQFVCNCLHATCMLHITIAHVLHTFIQMCATSCACMWHACSAEPNFCVCSTHAIWVYCMCSMCAAYMHSMCSKEADICAAHKKYGCIVCATRVQRICTVRAARKQMYVQHTSSISVRGSFLISKSEFYGLVKLLYLSLECAMSNYNSNGQKV